jgi:hypothetical protein
LLLLLANVVLDGVGYHHDRPLHHEVTLCDVGP